MPSYIQYPIPHLLGRVSYPFGQTAPDGDTIHLQDPVLLLNGEVTPPVDGKLLIPVTGRTKPSVIRVRQSRGKSFVPVRLEGLDAPEEHYRTTAFSMKVGGVTQSFPVGNAVHYEDRAQPRWSPATQYLLKTLQRTGWALVMLDREIVDGRGRVLGYVYASDAQGVRGTFVSLELVKRGLAFPFLFESAGEFIAPFLAATAAAHKTRRGLWRHYQHKPLTYTETYASPHRYDDPEPASQLNAKLNLPGVFRRIVDAAQLQGLSLQLALQKYDAMDYTTGTVLPGDQYYRIPVERLIWAPHRFK